MSTNRLEQTSKYLQEKLLQWLPEHDQGIVQTDIEGLTLSRYDSTFPPRKHFYQPTITVVLQGIKRSVIGNEEYIYGRNHCMVVGVNLPGVYQITEASSEKPFLSVALRLDKYTINQLLTEMPPCSLPEKENIPGIVVSEVSQEIQDAFLRLIELLDNPTSIAVMAPMIIREIHFLLLNSSQGDCLCFVNSTGTKSHQIVQAVQWLKENYAQPLDVTSLAKLVNMSGSTFHRYFRQITTFSPLQLQKQLRLYEAERLMLLEGKNAKTAAFQVGYESVPQFSREYKRQFGAAPHQDITKKRV
ncbi:AraC family transcriptional regulator [Zophobihabitans entericus]|uniref:AraC family transcriptional regulator n=1 Tax=Zophobihabitans entericus TaxID=1635327 RepID=A0A6G9ICQ7_9GAMM|nr:AraC family transcriptional regulator [Zophobihabitans entericus]QIQ22015.1 AraC family transcriptional regulator [Zophobihabitans entericus]